MTALCGEFPAEQLYRLIPSQSYAEKTITQLKNEKMLRIHYKDKLRGYRLTKRAKQYLLETNPHRFSFYLTGNTDTNLIRSEPPRRLRLHQRAEGYLTLLHAGIRLFPDEKPAFFTNQMHQPLSLRSCPLFYTSREIKQLGEETTKIRNSRSLGILLTSQCAYVLYNTGTTLMKWEYRTEIRVNAFLQHYLKGNPYPHIPEIRAIIFGRNMETVLPLLTSTGGYKKSLFMLDTSYEHCHFVPSNPEGEALLKLLYSPKLSKNLHQLLCSDLEPKNPQLAVEHDAVTSEGELVLIAYDFDMIRINKFNTGLNLFGYSGVLIAFDFQLPVLKQYLSADIQYTGIDFLKFKRRFFHEP